MQRFRVLKQHASHPDFINPLLHVRAVMALHVLMSNLWHVKDPRLTPSKIALSVARTPQQ